MAGLLIDLLDSLAYDVSQVQSQFVHDEGHHNCRHGIRDLETGFFLNPFPQVKLVYEGRRAVEFGRDGGERNGTRRGQDESRGHSFCLWECVVIRDLIQASAAVSHIKLSNLL